ncbi:MAG: FecR domain-containing protein [Bacteroidetes bacterium]|nr:FecR domain-containing protein [Bacteroidota bacterium]
MDASSFRELIEQYITGSLSPENRETFGALLEKEEYRILLGKELERTFMEDTFEGEEPEKRRERLNQLINDKVAASSIPRIPMWKRSWVRSIAAAVVIAVATLLIYRRPPTTAPSQPQTADIAPGHDGAILTLADGSKVVLDSAENSALPMQGSASLTLKNNQLVYRTNGQKAAEVTYNVLSVPRGRQFKLVLPDGTKVWLNAASMLRYPIAFSGSRREVEVSGEAYFEVAPNATIPFTVKKGNTQIEVLGTHFNVNAYDNESTEDITLLEGSVRVANGGESVVIAPGQQARITTGIRVRNDVDLEEVIAWKEGKFQFSESADIHSIMRQIADWYDVDIQYAGPVNKHIGGAISRDVRLSEVLTVLETTGVVHFNIKGRTIEVLPGKK